MFWRYNCDLIQPRRHLLCELYSSTICHVEVCPRSFKQRLEFWNMHTVLWCSLWCLSYSLFCFPADRFQPVLIMFCLPIAGHYGSLDQVVMLSLESNKTLFARSPLVSMLLNWNTHCFTVWNSMGLCSTTVKSQSYYSHTSYSQGASIEYTCNNLPLVSRSDALDLRWQCKKSEAWSSCVSKVLLLCPTD